MEVTVDCTEDGTMEVEVAVVTGMFGEAVEVMSDESFVALCVTVRIKCKSMVSSRVSVTAGLLARTLSSSVPAVAVVVAHTRTRASVSRARTAVVVPGGVGSAGSSPVADGTTTGYALHAPVLTGTGPVLTGAVSSMGVGVRMVLK